MFRWITAALLSLLLAAPLAAQTFDDTGAQTVANSDRSSTATLGALNAVVSVRVDGRVGVGFFLTTANLSATLTPEFTIDTGNTNWEATSFVTQVPGSSATIAATAAFTGIAATEFREIVLPAGARQARVRVSTYASGTSTGSLRATGRATSLISVPVAAGASSQIITDGSGAGQADVIGTAPTTEQGLVVRNIPSGTQTVTGTGGTFPVTDSGGSLTIDGAVTANAGTNLNTSALALEASLVKLPVAQGSTTAGQSGPLAQGAVTTSAPTYTTAQTAPLSLDTAGALRVTGTGGGSVTQGTSPWVVGQASAAALNATVVGTGTFPTQADTELPAAGALADATANPTITGAAAYNMIWNGSTWDRMTKTGWTVTANAGTGVFDVTPASPAAGDYLPVRLTDGSAFYTAGSGSGGTVDQGAAAADGTDPWPIALTEDGTDTVVKVADDANKAVRVNVVAGGGSGGGTSMPDDDAFTGGTTDVTPIGALFDATPPTVTDGSIGAPRMDANRILMVAQPTASALNTTVTDGSGALTVDGTVAVTQATAANLNATVTDGSGALTVDGTVTANAGTNLNTSALALEASLVKIPVAQGSTTSGQSGPLSQGAVSTANPTYVDGQTSPLSLNEDGELRVTGGSGGSSGVPDDDPFTFGTTDVTPMGAVVDDTSTNTATENSVAAPRMSTDRKLLVREHNSTTILGEETAQTTSLAVIDNLPLAQNQTTSGQSGVLAMGAVTTSAPSYTTAQTSPLSMDTAGALRVSSSGVAVTNGFVSTQNSTAVALGGSGVFTGTGDDVTNYSTAIVSVVANVASASNGLSIQASSDNTNWDVVRVATIAANSPQVFAIAPGAKFFRVVYTNAGSAQASFRLQTVYKTSSQGTESYDLNTQLTQHEYVQGVNIRRSNSGSGASVEAGTIAEPLYVLGNVTTDSALAQHTTVGGRGLDIVDTNPGGTPSGTGTAVYLTTERHGGIFAHPHGPRAWHTSNEYTTQQTDATVKASPGANQSLYITDISLSCNGAATISIEESTTTLKWRHYCAAAGDGKADHFIVPIKITGNTLVSVTSSAAITFFLSLNGFTQP